MGEQDFGYVYFIQAGGLHGDVKIGWAGDPEARLKDLQVGSSRELRLLCKIKARERSAERDWQKHFADHGVRGEWFSWSPEIALLVRLASAYTPVLNALMRMVVAMQCVDHPSSIQWRAVEDAEAALRLCGIDPTLKLVIESSPADPDQEDG